MPPVLRYLTALALIAATLLAATPAARAFPERQRPALVFELTSGRVLIARHAGQPWHPASLTKLMTGYLVLNAVARGELRWRQMVTVSKRAAAVVRAGIAGFGAKPGMKMTVRRMLANLLVRSDADMAVALAEAVAGSEAAFVRRMNTTARLLGMSATRFVNPHGLHDPAQVSTARDMALLAMAIYRDHLKANPANWRFFNSSHVGEGKRKRRNRNHLLFLMKGANGMKTGFLCAAGFNLVASAERGGRIVAAVVMGRKSALSRALYARTLLEAGFRRLAARRFVSSHVRRLNNVARPAPDMSDICKRSQLQIADFTGPQGWAAMLGPYKGLLRAEAALDATLLLTGLDATALPAGIARLPQGGRAAAFLWDMTEAEAAAFCARARRTGATCATLAPPEFRRLATAIGKARAERARKAAMRRKARARQRAARKKAAEKKK